MSSFLDSFAYWLADFYLMATALLVTVLAVLAVLKQPVRRLVVSTSALISLALLAGLCALPGWSLVHLIAERNSPSQPIHVQVQREAASEKLASQISAVATRSDTLLPPNQSLENSPKSASIWPIISQSQFIGLVHILGIAIVLAWLGVGALTTWRLLRHAQRSPDELQRLLEQLVVPNTRPVKLLVSNHIDVPAAFGVLRPTVLLPTSWIERRSYRELRTVLIHELAHIRNGDLAWLAASRILLVLLWAQPLYWLLRRRMRLDQEALADAAAAEQAGRRPYAEQLVAWARDLSAKRRLVLPAAMGLWESPSQLRRRVALLLDERLTLLRNCPRTWRYAVTALTTIVALSLSLVTLRPETQAQSTPRTAIPGQSADGQSLASEPSQHAGDELPPDDFIPTGTFTSAFAVVTDSKNRDLTPNSISGRCTDENGTPLTNVEAILFRVNEGDGALKQVGTQRTNEEGRFRFADVVDLQKEFPDGKAPNLPTGENTFWQLVLRAPSRASIICLSTSYELAHNGVRIDQKMPPAKSLRGRVVGPDGAPVVDALVTAIDFPWSVFAGAKTAQTDSDGRYEISDLAPFDVASYRKAASAFEAQLRDGTFNGDASTIPTPAIVVVTHPNFATFKSECEDVPGTKDIQLQPAARIAGRVVYGESDQPAANVAVQASSLGRSKFNFSEKTATDADGRFQFINLPAGFYDLWADADGWLNEGISNFKTVDGELTSVPDIRLIHGGRIRARLIDGSSNEPIKPKPTDRAIFEVRPKTRLMSRNYQQHVSPGVDGIFEFMALPDKNWISLGAVISDEKVQWTQYRDEKHRQPVYATVVEGKSTVVDISVMPVSKFAAKSELLFGAKLPNESTVGTKNDQGAATNLPQIPPASAKIVGQVTSQNGQPLPGVRVRVAVPAVDMRFLYPEYDGAKYEVLFLAETDDDGRYELEMPTSAQGRLVSVDAMKPGYARLADVGRSDGGTRYVTIAPGKDNDVSFSLKPALYVKGVVVDEKGNPIVNAEIDANATLPGTTWGIESTGSGMDGSFEIFSFPVQPESHDGQIEKGRIGVNHADYVHDFIDDVYKLSEEERTSLKIVLPTGHQVSGVVLDADDKPVPNVIVESNNMAGGDKGVMTDDAGRFAIRGLVDGSYRIRVHAMSLHQRATVPFKLDSDYADLQIRLQPITLTKEPKTVNVLGMTLTDTNKELKAAYDLFLDRGALILNPGKDSLRLNIGELEEGDCFWRVGERQISNVREFAENVLANAEKQESGEYKCRVVYSFRRLNYLASTNTQYLKLTERDLQSLRDLLANWPSD